MKEASPGKVLWAVPFYLLWILWIQHLVNKDENLRLYKEFVTMRCRTSAGVTAAGDDYAGTFKDACANLSVSVDGTWGGGYARPSVRLKIATADGQNWEYRYLFVDIHPLNGRATVRSETSEKNYYLNF